MAKAGGKGDGKRRADEKHKKSDVADKRADKKKDKSSVKAKAVVRAEAAKAGTGESTRSNGSAKLKPAKLKPVKLKGIEDTQRLVEQVAAEIVVAELDRATAKQGADAEAAVFSELLRAPAGAVDLAAIDPDSTPGVALRDEAEDELPKLAARLEELQERLFAAARGGDSNRKVLLVLQGMDTSGKGGTVRHVVGQLDPNGTRLTAFKAPTEEERAHDFLWRIRRALPAAGEIGIFDRSHYEDVLIARVRKLALPMVIGRRYQLINGFERKLVADGAVLVKCFLHISRDEQKQRLLARLDDPAKHWKYNPGDVDERELWPQYQDAYRVALEKCSTQDAPWYVVPADHKWYRNYAVTRLLVEALERIDPQYPIGDFDVEVERERVLAS
ncbi:MAG TPA: polyphosphate kinase 2 family protein [Actinocrinis sp.]|nr:polyphosphate kinase 2 family protein [Actinocrinis sp.]